MKKISLLAGIAVAILLGSGCANWKMSYYTIEADWASPEKMSTLETMPLKTVKAKYPYMLKIESVTINQQKMVEKKPEFGSLSTESKQELGNQSTQCEAIKAFIVNKQSGIFTDKNGEKVLPVHITFNFGKQREIPSGFRSFKCPRDPQNGREPHTFVCDCSVKVQVDKVVAEKKFKLEEYIRPVDAYQRWDYPSHISEEILKEPELQYFLSETARSLDEKALTNYFNHRPKMIK